MQFVYLLILEVDHKVLMPRNTRRLVRSRCGHFIFRLLQRLLLPYTFVLKFQYRKNTCKYFTSKNLIIISLSHNPGLNATPTQKKQKLKQKKTTIYHFSKPGNRSGEFRKIKGGKRVKLNYLTIEFGVWNRRRATATDRNDGSVVCVSL